MDQIYNVIWYLDNNNLNLYILPHGYDNVLYSMNVWTAFIACMHSDKWCDWTFHKANLI